MYHIIVIILCALYLYMATLDEGDDSDEHGNVIHSLCMYRTYRT